MKQVIDLQSRCIDKLEESLDAALTKVGVLFEERDSMRLLLANRYQIGQNQQADRKRSEMVKMLVGEGWDLASEESAFKKGRAQLIACVKGICGKDTLKQKQLCEALYARYAAKDSQEAAKKKAKAEEKLTLAHAAIVAGLLHLCSTPDPSYRPCCTQVCLHCQGQAMCGMPTH